MELPLQKQMLLGAGMYLLNESATPQKTAAVDMLSAVDNELFDDSRRSVKIESSCQDQMPLGKE